MSVLTMVTLAREAGLSAAHRSPRDHGIVERHVGPPDAKMIEHRSQVVGGAPDGSHRSSITMSRRRTPSAGRHSGAVPAESAYARLTLVVRASGVTGHGHPPEVHSQRV